MKSRMHTLTCRLLAVAALWPFVTLGQSAADADAKPAPAVEAKPAAAAAAPAATGDAVEYSKKGADTCLTCHDDAKVAAVFHTRHGQPNDARSPFGKGQLQCEACHGPGGNHTAKVKKGEERPAVIRFGRDSQTPVAVQNGTCLTCHGKSMNASWHAGPHDANKVSCASCHNSHVAKDPVLSARTQADVCYTCHVAQRGQFLKPYAHPVKQGKIACSDCHQPHGSTSEAQLVKATVNQTCYQCHAEKRGPFLWEHAPVPEDCSNCHAPHGSTNPGMLTARGPLLCQSCHSQQGHPSLSYGPSGLPGGTGPATSTLVLGNCMNCHSQVHGSNHPSGASLTR
jgi:DmsE family decaheme c-type cytochrome